MRINYSAVAAALLLLPSLTLAGGPVASGSSPDQPPSQASDSKATTPTKGTYRAPSIELYRKPKLAQDAAYVVETKHQLYSGGRANPNDSFMLRVRVRNITALFPSRFPQSEAALTAATDLDAGTNVAAGVADFALSIRASGPSALSTASDYKPLEKAAQGLFVLSGQAKPQGAEPNPQEGNTGLKNLLGPSLTGPEIKLHDISSSTLQASSTLREFTSRITARMASDLVRLDAATKEGDVLVTGKLTVKRSTDSSRIAEGNPLTHFGSGADASFAKLNAQLEEFINQVSRAETELRDFGPAMQKMLQDLLAEFGDIVRNLEGKNDAAEVKSAFEEAKTLVNGLSEKYKSLSGDALLAKLRSDAVSDFGKLTTAWSKLKAAVDVFIKKTTDSTLKEAVASVFNKTENIVKNTSATYSLLLAFYQVVKDLQPSFEAIGTVIRQGKAKADAEFLDLDFDNKDGVIGDIRLRSEDRLLFEASVTPAGGTVAVPASDSIQIAVYKDLYHVTYGGLVAATYPGGRTRFGTSLGASLHFGRWPAAEQIGIGLDLMQIQLRANDSIGFAIGSGITLFRDSFTLGIGHNFTTNERLWYFGLRRRF